MLVVNILGEPGAGKSATAAGVYYEFSVNGFQAEVVTEVAKAFAWETPKDKEGNALLHPIFSQQIFFLGEQHRGLARLIGQRDIAIMECPLIMGAIYTKEDYFEHFEPLVLEQFHVYNNLNIVLERNHKFDPQGRVHNEEQSAQVKSKLLAFLDKHHLPYIVMKTHPDINKEIVRYIRDNYFPDRKLRSDNT